MLAQAKKIDSGEIVEGYHYIDSPQPQRKHYITNTENALIDYEIDPKTLKYSFDDGVSFYSESEIQDKFKYIELIKKRNNSNSMSFDFMLIKEEIDLLYRQGHR